MSFHFVYYYNQSNLVRKSLIKYHGIFVHFDRIFWLNNSSDNSYIGLFYGYYFAELRDSDIMKILSVSLGQYIIEAGTDTVEILDSPFPVFSTLKLC